MIRLERHRLGPRVYVLGRRIHEYHLGLAVAALALVNWLLLGRIGFAVVLGAAAVWLVAKDWQDFVPSRRDTAAWRLGLHRRVCELRPARRGDSLPTLAAGAAATVGAINAISALTPNIAWRGHVLLALEPVELVPVFHALAVPASVGLVGTAFYLARRRRRALHAAIAFLLALCGLDLLKGLDLEEAAASFGLAALLWWGRDAFRVRHQPLRLRTLVALPALAAAVLMPTALAAYAAVPARGGAVDVAREALAILTWQRLPFALHDELAHVPLALRLLAFSAVLRALWLAFRPLAPPRLLPDGELRAAAAALVRAHGSDTLAFFKLRRDKHYLFDPTRRAFLGYRIESGVLLVSGDPVGPADALPALVRETCRFAELRGLRVGVLGASEAAVPLWRAAGLSRLYLGDEAIVETASFSLEGRPIRKVRQSVTRLEKAGFRIEVHAVGELDEAALAELEAVSAAWRAGAPERGFSMAMDSLAGADQRDSVVVVARDGEGRARGFLHFVPSYGRRAVSLSSMRRERDTPNGLTEFLVARGIELLRGRGVEEVSLNFAAFARLLHGPRGPLERALGRLVALANPFFQIESLYRFNAKFFPRWEPRYLLHEGPLALPRTGLAALWAEGQLPRPGIGKSRAGAAGA